MRIKRLARRLLFSRPVAYALGELPEVDVRHLFGDWRTLLSSPPARGVPKIVHMTAPSYSVGRTMAADLVKFINANNEFRFFIWTDHELKELAARISPGTREEKMLRFANLGVVRSDIGRYIVMKHLGGIYLDLKSRLGIPLRDIDFEHQALLVQERHLVPDLNLRASVPDGRIASNWFMAAPKDHPFFNRVIDECFKSYTAYVNRVRENVAESVWDATGPIMMTRCVAIALAEQEPDVALACELTSPLQPRYSCKGSWVPVRRPGGAVHYSTQPPSALWVE